MPWRGRLRLREWRALPTYDAVGSRPSTIAANSPRAASSSSMISTASTSGAKDHLGLRVSTKSSGRSELLVEAGHGLPPELFEDVQCWLLNGLVLAVQADRHVSSPAPARDRALTRRARQR